MYKYRLYSRNFACVLFCMSPGVAGSVTGSVTVSTSVIAVSVIAISLGLCAAVAVVVKLRGTRELAQGGVNQM